MRGAHKRTIKMAVVQMRSKTLKKEYNVGRSIELMEQAVTEGADLIVLPELCTSGYNFRSREEAVSVAEHIPDGPTTREWIDFAKSKNIYLVGGICECANNALYDSAVMVGPRGYIGTYRKVHLWGKEKLWFRAGTSFKVFNTELGKIGILICYDGFFPEASRIMMRMGAEIICQPTATHQELDLLIARVRSAENAIFIGVANFVGKERGLRFVGQSQITNPRGEILNRGDKSREDVITADIDIYRANEGKQLSELNNIISDRRTDLYLDFLGYVKIEEDYYAYESNKIA